MIESGEILIVLAFAVLTIAVMVLSALLARLIPLLHDSVSGTNLSPLYQALLPVAAKYAEAGLGEIGDALVNVAGRTDNKIDDEMARYLDMRFEALERRLRGDDPAKQEGTDKVKVEPLE